MDEAIKDAAGQTLDEAVRQGRLMPQQAERLRAGLERGRFWPCPRVEIRMNGIWLTEAAAVLEMKPQELLSALRQGKTLAGIAAERGVALSEVQEKVLAALKKRLDQAVADGRFTQERADQVLQCAESRIKSENWPCPRPGETRGFGLDLRPGQGRGFGNPL